MIVLHFSSGTTDCELAAGHDLGGLLRAAKHGQTASATGRSHRTPRGQHGEQDCAMHGLIWTVLRYTRPLPFTRQRLSCSDTFRVPVEEMLKVYTTSCGVSNVDAAAGW